MTEADEKLKAAVRQTVKTESQYRYRQIVWTVVPALVITAAIIAVIAGEALHIATRVDNNQNSIRANNIKIARDTAAVEAQVALIAQLNEKVCHRVNDTRGVLILQLVRDTQGKILKSDLPLYRCQPGATDGAIMLTPAATQAYLQTLTAGRTPGP